jgi:hypothetical protein
LSATTPARIVDRHEIDIDLVGLEDHCRAADGEFPDPAVPEPAAHDHPFGVAPGLELQETTDDERKLLGEILDGALHDTGCFRIALDQQRVQLLLADLLARFVAERVVTGLAQRLSPVLDDGAKGFFAGAIADESLVVLELDVVAVDVDRRETSGAMRRDRRQGCALFGHERIPVKGP